MPEIRPSVELRNNYSDISSFCHKFKEPIYITKNGKGDLAVMSIELYEELIGKRELLNLIDEGLEAINQGKQCDAKEFFDTIEKEVL